MNIPFVATGRSNPIETNTVSASSLGNAAGAAVTFAPFTPAQGTDSYYVAVKDTGTTPGAVGPANYNFISATNTVIANATPSIKLSITNATLDSGQTETFDMQISGGTSPFAVELYNITGSKPVGNVIISSPSGAGSSNSISFEVHTLNDGSTFTYKAIATDLGPTTPFTFTSNSNTMTVNTNMTVPKAEVGGHFYDQGQTVALSSTIPTGGTPPYLYSFTVTNATTLAILTGCTKFSIDICPFTATQMGTYYANVIVTDSASTPANSESVNPANFIVGPNFEQNSRATVEPSVSIISSGSSISLNAMIVGLGGTPPYTYTFAVYNATTSKLVYTSTPFTTNAATNSLVYMPANNGIYYAKVTITDNATPAELITSSPSDPFLVGSAATPTIVLTAANPTLDSGQTEVFTATAFGGVGPFNVELYNMTGSKQQGSNVTIASPGKSNTFNLAVSASSATVYSYNAIATDTTTHITSSSSAVQITVNPPFGDDIVLSTNSMDLGQSVLITENVHGGTSPYKYYYNIYQGSNTPIYTQLESNALTTNSYAYTPTGIGTFTTNVIVTDSSGMPATTNSSTKSFTVYNSPSISITPSKAILTSSQSETYTATVSNGIGPFEVELYNQTGRSAIGNFIVPADGSNTIVFTVNSPATGNTISFDAVATDLGTSVPYTFSSASNTITVISVAPPTSSTTTVSGNGGGGNSGGGGGGGGGAGGGGGSALPTVLPYNATTVHGWKVLNFSQDNSESLKVNGHMFDITLNSISPTLVDVTVNGYAYTLNPSQPVPLTGLSNYSVELVSISYLPIEDTAVVQLYGPNQLAKTNTTSTSSGNVVSSNTKTTVKTTATTTVATTTVPPKVSTVKPTTTVSAPPASTEELGAGIIVVILLVIGGMYYYLRFNKKGKRR